jgi:hypothetical protein
MTTESLRKEIKVLDYYEDQHTIVVKYTKCGELKLLPVDKTENTELMEIVEGPISQWDALSLAIHHELILADQEYDRCLKEGSLFQMFADIAISHARANGAKL